MTQYQLELITGAGLCTTAGIASKTIVRELPERYFQAVFQGSSFFLSGNEDRRDLAILPFPREFSVSGREKISRYYTMIMGRPLNNIVKSNSSSSIVLNGLGLFYGGNRSSGFTVSDRR